MLIFSTPIGRDNWLGLVGGETTLERLEKHTGWIPCTIEQQNTIKRFLVKEPTGRSIFLDCLDRNPNILVNVRSYELLPPHDIPGKTLFSSYNYIIKETSGFGNRGDEVLLIEQNTCMIDTMKYTF